MWLANRFDEVMFPGVERVKEMSEEFTQKMHTALQEMYQEGARPIPRERKAVKDIVKVSPALKVSYMDFNSELSGAAVAQPCTPSCRTPHACMLYCLETRFVSSALFCCEVEKQRLCGCCRRCRHLI